MKSENIPDNGNAGGKALRLLRPSIVVLCGPAACGKSTFAIRHFRPTQIISSDWARAYVCDDERDQRFNAQAFALVHFLVEQRLTVNRLCVVDSTALTPQSRKELLDLARKHQVPATLMLFNVPLETCIERDEKRERSVGRVIVERQYQAFEQTKATIRQEGFGQVEELQDGDLEKVQIEILFRPVVPPVQRPQRPDPGAPRRFEYSARPSGPRPRGPSDGGHADSTALGPPVARPAAVSRPATTAGSVSTPKVATARPGEAPVPVVGAQPTSAVHPPASAASANKPSLLTPTAAPPKPASPVAPRPVPVVVESSGGS
ncbi:MAG: AAA family ATPase [Terriglobia bacterium]|jgi:protein phosphatase